jgi:predicted HTH domain antitoxin
MTVSFELPRTTEEALRAAWGGDLSQAAKEAFIIESYRTGRISVSKVAEILGLETSLEGQAWLASRGVDLNYDIKELEADRATLQRLFPNTPL